MKTINKVAALCIQDKKLLVVYKPSIEMYITPGGKIEPGETELQCLQRELQEEVGCGIKNPVHFATYKGTTPEGNPLRLSCYLCKLNGNIKLNPNDSINGYRWISLNTTQKLPLAPLLRSYIIPTLSKGDYS